MLENKSSRTVINIIGVPSILAIIIAGDSFYQLPIFSFFITIVLLLGTLEIPILFKDTKVSPNIFILIIFLILLQISRHPLIIMGFTVYDLLIGITLLTMIWEVFQKKSTPLLNISSALFSFIWIGLMLGSLSELRNLPVVGLSVTMSLFISVWICDTAAFVFGMKFGNRKILPQVSPNKTWVGSIAGLFFSLFFMIFLYKIHFFDNSIVFIDILFLGIISGIFGQLGDFAESLLKREANIKDTSNLLRGHGGVLDRFDSLSFAAPLTLLYCNYFI
tara:strand:- start:1148 stop:1975 length:828 start_codon:yes stop_codon:yes gene_type:complete